MAYNKAKAEKEWLRWKEVEEKKLRELGVDEETIQRLHTYDWAQFNKERQYLQRQVEWSPYVELISAQDLELPVEDTEALLDSIEDSVFFHFRALYKIARIPKFILRPPLLHLRQNLLGLQPQGRDTGHQHRHHQQNAAHDSHQHKVLRRDDDILRRLTEQRSQDAGHLLTG